jgi:hypothetical protein
MLPWLLPLPHHALLIYSADPQVSLLGASQALFEASMYTFVYLWTPPFIQPAENLPHGFLLQVTPTASGHIPAISVHLSHMLPSSLLPLLPHHAVAALPTLQILEYHCWVRVRRCLRRPCTRSYSYGRLLSTPEERSCRMALGFGSYQQPLATSLHNLSMFSFVVLCCCCYCCCTMVCCPNCADPRVSLLGASQALFEASMYTFVFLWTPALSPRGEKLPHGFIFAIFMTASMVGTALAGRLLRSCRLERLMQVRWRFCVSLFVLHEHRKAQGLIQ